MDGVRDLLDCFDRADHALTARLNALGTLQDGIHLLGELAHNARDAVKLLARLIDLLDAFADVLLLRWRV